MIEWFGYVWSWIAYYLAYGWWQFGQMPWWYVRVGWFRWSTPFLMLAVPVVMGGSISYALSKNEPSYNRASAFWAFSFFTMLPLSPVLPALWYTSTAVTFATIKTISLSILGIFVLGFLLHTLNCMNKNKKQFYAEQLAAYRNRERKILEEFNAAVVQYTHQESVNYHEKLTYFSTFKTPLHAGNYLPQSRRQLRKFIADYKGSHPTLDASADAIEQELRQRRDEARSKAPEYAAFLNGYARLLVKFKPGTLPTSDDMWVECADGNTRSAHLLSENGHEWAVNFLAGHLRWRSDWHDAFAGCPKCNKGIVQTRRESHYCTCVDAFKAKVRQSADIDVLRHITFQADQLPAWMYDVIEAEIDVLRRLFFSADDQQSPTELIAQIEKKLTDQYMAHQTAQGNIILGYPVSISGVYDATHELPVVSTPGDLSRHGYLRGKTGAGKTTALQYRLTQMFHLPRRGTITVSPERGLFKSRLLPYIPRNRYEDVLYINPDDDSSEVMGTNPLILRTGENYRKKRQHLAVTFNRALGPFGVSMLPLFVNGVGALLLRPNSSILDFKPLLNLKDDSLRRELARSSALSDNTRAFWAEYGGNTYYHSTAAAVLNRLLNFFEEPLRSFFTTDAIKWHKELNFHARHIFIDTSDMGEGSDETRITVELLMAQILYTVTLRDGWEDARMIPYSMFIDEFWQYTNADPKTWAGIFNQARKFLLDVTPAHQVSDNINKDVIGLIMHNVGTIMAGQLARGDAAMFSGELQFKGEDGKLRPDIFMNFNPGHMGVMTPKNKIGIPVYIPQQQLVPRTPDYAFDELVSFSKKTHGKKPEQPQGFTYAAPESPQVKANTEAKRPRGRPRKDSTKPQPAAEEWIEEGL